MGSFYTNITLRTPDSAHGHLRQDLVRRGLAAYIARPERGAFVIFERESETQDPAILNGIAADLSAKLGCAALATLNHDDDVLVYWLFQNGKLVDEYNSAPDYFGEDDDAERGGDAATLASAFGVPDKAREVAAILALGKGDDGVVFETDRHDQLVDALGLPKSAVGTGYTYLDEGEYPEGYGPEDFEKVGG